MIHIAYQACFNNLTNIRSASACLPSYPKSKCFEVLLKSMPKIVATVSPNFLSNDNDISQYASQQVWKA